MQITINGEPQNLSTISTIAELMAQLGVELRGVAVEQNQRIVPKSRYAETTITEGDAIEIISFIGGG